MKNKVTRGRNEGGEKEENLTNLIERVFYYRKLLLAEDDEE